MVCDVVKNISDMHKNAFLRTDCCMKMSPLIPLCEIYVQQNERKIEGLQTQVKYTGSLTVHCL
jgi:hypothetical protein